MIKPTIAQLAYINDLYNKLDVRYPLREKPQDTVEASALIRKLKDQVTMEPKPLQAWEGDDDECRDV